MSDAKRTKEYIIYKLRKSYREGKLDTSQIARLKTIGFDFDGAVFNASKDSLAVQYHWEYLDEKKEVSTDDHHQADGRAE